jgi:hypothetical protein
MKKKIIVAVALLAVRLVFAGCANAVNALLLKGKWTNSSTAYFDFDDNNTFTGHYGNCTLSGTYEFSGTNVILKYTVTNTSTSDQYPSGADSNGQYTTELTLTTSSNPNHKDYLEWSSGSSRYLSIYKYYRQSSL